MSDVDLPQPGENTPGLISVPTNTELQARVVSVRRRIGDLPDIPERMNTVSVVLSYELFGLSEQDTADALDLDVHQIGRIRMLDAYTEMRTAVVQNIMDTDTDDVRRMFIIHSKGAANKMVELVDSEFDNIALSAASAILDRGGHSPRQIIEHQHHMEGELVIRHIKRDNSGDIPIIEHKDVEDG